MNSHTMDSRANHGGTQLDRVGNFVWPENEIVKIFGEMGRDKSN